MPNVDKEQMTHYEGYEAEHPECAEVKSKATKMFSVLATESDGSQWVRLEEAVQLAYTARYAIDRLVEIRELALETSKHYDLPMSYVSNMLTRIIEATDIVTEAKETSHD